VARICAAADFTDQATPSAPLGPSTAPATPAVLTTLAVPSAMMEAPGAHEPSEAPEVPEVLAVLEVPEAALEASEVLA
jgi:hypothetical protein